MLYEEMILILDGRGSTTVWKISYWLRGKPDGYSARSGAGPDASARVTFEWKAGAMFAIPLNCWHQHFNASGREPVRFVAVTNAPPFVNMFEDMSFVLGCDYDFKGRFSGEPDYFSQQGRAEGLPADHQHGARCGEPAAARIEGARRRFRSHPLQHGQGLAAEPHLAVPGRHLQEGALPRPRRTRDRAVGRGLLADVAARARSRAATTGRSAR